ncbi:MAG: helix-turn-helix domain-containing protein [Phormidium sp.]|jgi:transcriptional regulator with XRE-family HTH domain|nr:MAG: putative transcriptional regulator [Phormidium sp. OSCR]
MQIAARFGHRVRSVRKLRGFSQEQLAEHCGLHRTYIGSVERGERNITLVNAQKIAEALSVSLCDLVQENE